MNIDKIVNECFDYLPGNLDQNEEQSKALIKSAIQEAIQEAIDEFKQDITSLTYDHLFNPNQTDSEPN